MSNILSTAASDELLGKVPSKLLIGGTWTPSTSSEEFLVIDPATEKTIASVSDATPHDALAAADAAAASGNDWASVPPRQRAEILRKTFELMCQYEVALAQLIVRENGKAMPDALGEVRYAAEFFRWFSEEAVRNQGSLLRSPSGDKRIMVDFQPIGVALLITPWNFPAAMATRKIAPALAAGCSVVLKPAEETPLTALALGTLLMEAGAPAGVVNIVTTNDPGPVVDALLHHPKVRKLSFTGSTEVGRLLLRSASERVISCSMELGGNAPFIVFSDADIDEAVNGAMIAKMRNGGEACTAANRFYVEESIAHEFSQALAKAMSSLKVGNGLDPEVELGPLINQMQREKVERLLEDTTSKGAEIVTGGKRLMGSGYFLEPTVVVDVPPSSDLLNEEIFGPVAPIVTFDGEDEAIYSANNTEFGLVSYVYTKDLSKGLRVANKLDAGMVAINRGLVSDPAAPFGGTKQSGLGREGGHDGLLEFLEPKYIALDW